MLLGNFGSPRYTFAVVARSFSYNEDIFLRVPMTEWDHDILRFSWWTEEDALRQPKELKLTVHMFGAFPRPFALTLLSRNPEQNLAANTFPWYHERQ